MNHAVTAYALDVVEGRVVTGPAVRWACERHLRDLSAAESDADASEFWFDESAADDVVEFFGLTRHFEGEWGQGQGEPFELEPWQKFVTGCLFGWRRHSDGTRRFRIGWIEVARKNGKSTWLAVIGLYLLCADGEPGAQVWNAATKLKQARIIHRAAIKIRDKSPELRREVERFKDRLVYGDSYFAPLARDAKTEDGLNPHAALCDEIHAWPDGAMWDVLVSALGSRRQPLLLAITTAGFDRFGFGAREHDYYRQIVDPESGLEDNQTFVYICELDPSDDPFDEASWAKANPNLGVSVSLDYLRAQACEAQQKPRARNNFLVKHCNIWTSGAETWLPVDQWDACAGPWVVRAASSTVATGPVDAVGTRRAMLDALAGETAYAGLDLASTEDLTAVVLVFPFASWAVVPWFWLPSEALSPERDHRDRVVYGEWTRNGFIEATDGDSIDYERIFRTLLDLARRFHLARVAVDPWNARHMTTRLVDAGLDVVEVPQGFAHLSAPSKLLESQVRRAELAHGANPVLRWMAGHVRAKENADGAIRPVKERRGQRIDGIIALVMALGQATTSPEARRSVYETMLDEPTTDPDDGDPTSPPVRLRRSVYEDFAK